MMTKQKQMTFNAICQIIKDTLADPLLDTRKPKMVWARVALLRECESRGFTKAEIAEAMPLRHRTTLYHLEMLYEKAFQVKGYEGEKGILDKIASELADKNI